MGILVVGLSHHTAGIELRERVAVAPATLPGLLGRLTSEAGVGEAVLLSTCNRVEVCSVTAGGDPHAGDRLISVLARSRDLDPDALRPHLYVRGDRAAVGHLFRVAAGLDSLVVGEPQILGQVKEAFAAAESAGTTGTTLKKLFPWAFTVGKRVRNDTGLGEGAVSVSYAAVALARKIFGDLEGRSVVLVGAGEMSKLAAQHLQAQHVRQVLITSRTFEHAEQLAHELGGPPAAAPVLWDRLDDLLRRADIVLTATGASTPILTRQRIEAARRSRRANPLFLIDIAVPRDVDPEVADLEQVFLYNIDDLQSIVDENRARRVERLGTAEAIVEEETERFLGWLRSRDAVPTIVALRQRFEAIRRTELQRLESKLGPLTPDARRKVDEVTRLIVEKLLVGPTEQLKTLSDRDAMLASTDVLTRLFGLTPDAPAAADVGTDTDRPARQATTGTPR